MLDTSLDELSFTALFVTELFAFDTAAPLFGAVEVAEGEAFTPLTLFTSPPVGARGMGDVIGGVMDGAGSFRMDEVAQWSSVNSLNRPNSLRPVVAPPHRLPRPPNRHYRSPILQNRPPWALSNRLQVTCVTLAVLPWVVPWALN